MKRVLLPALFILLSAGAARADEPSVRADQPSIPELRIRPGAGIGLATVSVELSVEGIRWYGGAQLALAGATVGAGIAAYGGLRGGAFLTESANAPFIGLGIGALGESDRENASSVGWGASGEIGLALRRDERWFHPQFVVQGILPFSQRPVSTLAHESTVVLMFGARIYL